MHLNKLDKSHLRAVFHELNGLVVAGLLFFSEEPR